ncbi:MAG: AmmeMemoRadiSam system protein B [Ignavibacteriales bacterium]|nr:AmmeMemoRadiSam system protein B [Ignavibacteriales bacterium]
MNQFDRQPAVAGQFYPSNPTELKSTLKTLFIKAIPSKNLQNVVAMIVPHAGYIFSGEVAASAFNQSDWNKNYENIFIIGSSHHVGFEGASIYSHGNFITPLGTVKVNAAPARKLLQQSNVFSDRTDAHVSEHSLEVQLPFLQYMMKKDFQIIPIVIGTQSEKTCKKIADALRPYLNSKNLFIISTDFSHYPSYDDAAKIDKVTADAIISNSFETLLTTLQSNEKKEIPNLATSLCGWTSVLTLLSMTDSNPNITFNLVQYKNSGDAEVGDKNRVVGYYAIAVSLKEGKGKAQFSLSEKDEKDLLAIARNTVVQYVKERKVPDVDAAKLSENVKKNCGAFVTLHKRGAVLTPMQKINSIDEIELGKHGIYIKKGNRGGTFLPQVAKETGWTKEEFLGHCAQDKAGIGWDGWKDADIYIYKALVFSEK